MDQVQYDGSISNKIYLNKNSISPENLMKLKEYFRVISTKYAFLFKKYGRVSPSIPTHINCYQETDDQIILSMGVMPELMALIPGHRFILKDEEYKSGKIEFNQIYHTENYTLRDYQEKTIEQSIDKKKCILVAGCGAGKTVMAMEIIKRLSVPTTILVHTRELFEQWYNMIKTYLGIEPGVFYGPNRILGQVNISTSQLLSRKNAIDPDTRSKLFNTGLVIVDECHVKHYSLANHFNAEYKIGLTATPIRSDGTTQFISWTFGPEILASSHEELVEKGYRVEPYYKVVETKFYYALINPDEYCQLVRRLLNDPERNRLILNHVINNVKEGRHCLVLTGVKKHAEILAESLKNHGILAEAVHGDIPIKERFDSVTKMKNGKISVIVATTIADIGLDIPILDTLFLTYPSKSSSLNTQRAGRIMRIHPDKHIKPLIIDFVDSKVNMLKQQASKRRHAFEKICKL